MMAESGIKVRREIAAELVIAAALRRSCGPISKEEEAIFTDEFARLGRQIDASLMAGLNDRR